MELGKQFAENTLFITVLTKKTDFKSIINIYNKYSKTSNLALAVATAVLQHH